MPNEIRKCKSVLEYLLYPFPYKLFTSMNFSVISYLMFKKRYDTFLTQKFYISSVLFIKLNPFL